MSKVVFPNNCTSPDCGCPCYDYCQEENSAKRIPCEKIYSEYLLNQQADEWIKRHKGEFDD